MGLGDIVRLVTGAGAAHGILAIATPLLTRIYSPDEFGQFQIYATTFAFLLVIVLPTSTALWVIFKTSTEKKAEPAET